MKTKFGIVGCGFLGNIVADAWKNGLLPDYELVGVTSRTRASRSPAADPSSTRQPRCCPEIRSPQYPILFSYRILNSFFLPVAAYS